MKRLLWSAVVGLGLSCFAHSSPASAAKGTGGVTIALQSNRANSNEPLTLDQINELDPAQPNPQLRRWLVERKIEISNWQNRKLPRELVGVGSGGIAANTIIHLRPSSVPGDNATAPWYDEPSQFPCQERQPDPVYSTFQGATDAAAQAADLWEEMLSGEKIRLATLLGKVAAVNEKSASSKADRVFQEWLFRLDREWRLRVNSEVMPRVWKAERERAQQAGYCKGGSRGMKVSQKMTSPDVWMALDLPEVRINPAAKPLSRAPARRWKGFFSVRMDLKVGENSIIGQMLIDTETPRSVLSPEWMRSQGMPPEWVLVPEAQPEHVKIFAGEGKTGLGEVMQVADAELSNYRLSLHRFLMSSTELFDEPDFAAPCCSGVFGIDLFRRYIVDFHAAKPAEVLLWGASQFEVPAGYQWIEARENSQGEIQAICSERAKSLFKIEEHANKICRDPRQNMRDATGGMIFDLPHGRIWYSPEELAAPDYKNTSGLSVTFDYVKGDRALVVTGLAKTPTTLSLEKAGLKKGMVITALDGLPTVEMDLWEVSRRLSGVYGDTVKVSWSTPQGVKVEPIRIIERAVVPVLPTRTGK